MSCSLSLSKVKSWSPLLAVVLAVLCWVGSLRWWKLWVCTHFFCLLKPPNLWNSYSTLEVRHAVLSMNTKNLGMWSKLMNCKMENAAGFLQGGRPIQPHQSMNNCCCGSRGKRGISCRNPSNIMCPCAYIYEYPTFDSVVQDSSSRARPAAQPAIVLAQLSHWWMAVNQCWEPKAAAAQCSTKELL